MSLYYVNMNKIDPLMYSKGKTNRAGDVLRKENIVLEEQNDALVVLSNWRASYAYPMHVFKNRLTRVASLIDKRSISAQRLKRVPSIIKKLNRFSIRLTQIQDIAGCRVVMSDVSLVKKLYDKYYLTSDLKHKLVRVHDYINQPKINGYRSLHLIYEFKSDKVNKEIYNGLLVEIQIRSKLQHLWATAVETVSFFTNKALKLDEGEKDWYDFFRLVSSAFAMTEKSALVLDTPYKEKELYSMIKKREKELDVISKLNQWTELIRDIDSIKTKTGAHLFLLKLDINLKKLSISSYSDRQESRALKEYAEFERDIYRKKGYDVLLVGVDMLKNLKKAYPNYFLDTKEFIIFLNKILNKYND